MASEHLFETRAARDAALAADIAARLAAAVDARGAASLVATGGSTPAPCYDALARLAAPWDRVAITLTDERWAPTSDPASNERQVRERLLVGPAATARLVPLKTEAATPDLAAPAVEAALAALPRPFDAVILGMGPDGHFASLFPSAPELAKGLDPRGEAAVIPILREGAAGAAERLSLTLAALLDARVIAILIDGPDKRDVVRRAQAGSDTTELPIRAILNQSSVPVVIWWAP